MERKTSHRGTTIHCVQVVDVLLESHAVSRILELIVTCAPLLSGLPVQETGFNSGGDEGDDGEGHRTETRCVAGAERTTVVLEEGVAEDMRDKGMTIE